MGHDAENRAKAVTEYVRGFVMGQVWNWGSEVKAWEYGPYHTLGQAPLKTGSHWQLYSTWRTGKTTGSVVPPTPPTQWPQSGDGDCKKKKKKVGGAWESSTSTCWRGGSAGRPGERHGDAGRGVSLTNTHQEMATRVLKGQQSAPGSGKLNKSSISN